MWMHQFKGTVLLQAGSSSLATKCVCSECTFACISEMCLFLGLLAVRAHRQDPAIPPALREGQGSGLLYLGARQVGLSPSDSCRHCNPTRCWQLNHWCWQLPWLQESTWTPQVHPEKGEKLLALPLSFPVPGSSLQELLLNQNFHQSMQVTGDFSQSLTAWPSILRLQFFFPHRFLFVQRLPQGSSYSN